MHALEELATYAATHRIRGRSYKRNSLLKPLDIILDELDRCPNTSSEDELRLIRTGSKGLILEHIRRVTKGVREDAVYHYVDCFFDEVLGQTRHSDVHSNVNRLLQREQLIRSAYLVYMRQAIANIFIVRGKSKNVDEAMQEIQKSEEQETDIEETE